MGQCHYCMNCGRCRGEMPPAIIVHRCPACGFVNEDGTVECAACGASLQLDPSKVLRPPVGGTPQGKAQH